jgi:hypothetical protein
MLSSSLDVYVKASRVRSLAEDVNNFQFPDEDLDERFLSRLFIIYEFTVGFRQTAWQHHRRTPDPRVLYHPLTFIPHLSLTSPTFITFTLPLPRYVTYIAFIDLVPSPAYASIHG